MRNLDYESFVNQWNLDTIPACNVGMLLLRNVFDSFDSETFWDTLKRYENGQPIDSDIDENPYWKAFSEHCTFCEDCNES
jgi:hypothetical protein